MDATKSDSYQLWLSDRKENNYRYAIDSSYKANRTKPKPIHFGAVHQYLQETWGAQVSSGQEADDALGIHQNKDTVICSIDKDLLQVEGKHYNWVIEEFKEITKQQGLAHFYQQCLTGDRTDNIFSGIERMGIVKAQRLIAYCETEQEMFETVRDNYDNDEKLLVNGRLLWIRRSPDQLWSFPTFEE